MSLAVTSAGGVGQAGLLTEEEIRPLEAGVVFAQVTHGRKSHPRQTAVISLSHHHDLESLISVFNQTTVA